MHKEQIKIRMRPYYWELYDETLGAIWPACAARRSAARDRDHSRVGKVDAPGPGRIGGPAESNRRPSRAADATTSAASFDRYDPASLEIAAWDDHPNALGHHRLFLALARSLVKDEARYGLLFPKAPASDRRTSGRHPRKGRCCPHRDESQDRARMSKTESERAHTAQGVLANLTLFPGSGRSSRTFPGTCPWMDPVGASYLTRPSPGGPITPGARRCTRPDAVVRGTEACCRSAGDPPGAVGCRAWRPGGPVAAQVSPTVMAVHGILRSERRMCPSTPPGGGGTAVSSRRREPRRSLLTALLPPRARSLERSRPPAPTDRAPLPEETAAAPGQADQTVGTASASSTAGDATGPTSWPTTHASPLAPCRDPDDLAYILFTSGSTGSPRESCCRMPMRSLSWTGARKPFSRADDDRFSSHAAVSF